jgi:predicted DNA-binding transcriptional regulator AlpA
MQTMSDTKWLPAKQVAQRYGTSEKWPWHQQKKDPRFPKGIRFSNGMTRWSRDALDAYDGTLIKN